MKSLQRKVLWWADLWEEERNVESVRVFMCREVITNVRNEC